MKPLFVGFCGKYKSGKTTLRDATQYEFTKRVQAGEIQSPYPDSVSFATPLKEFCVQTLGLSYSQVYGADKNTLTTYTWGQMPGYSRVTVCDLTGHLQFNDKSDEFMTAREVMQWWGTEVFRTMDPDFFVKKVQDYQGGHEYPLLADDVRFGNEAALCDTLIHVVGDGEDTHSSETAVLPYHMSIDTQQISIEQAASQCVEFIVGRMSRA